MHFGNLFRQRFVANFGRYASEIYTRLYYILFVVLLLQWLLIQMQLEVKHFVIRQLVSKSVLEQIFLIYTSPGEALLADMKILIVCTVIICILFVVLNLNSYVVPALYRHEQYILYAGTTALFCIVIFSAFFTQQIMPTVLKLFCSAQFSNPDALYRLSMEAKISELLGFMSKTYGILFVFIILAPVLLITSIFTPAAQGKITLYRKTFYGFSIILLAACTGSNSSLCFSLVPVVLCYMEINILTALTLVARFRVDFEDPEQIK